MRMGVSRMGGSASTARAPQRSFARRLILLGQRILRSDHILITVIAVSMSLSAVAVYQATRAADEAGDLLDQVRIVSAEASRQVGYLQTLVDHDLDVLRNYCAAEVQRDVARVTYLSETPDLPALVTANLTLDGLRPLLLGDQDAECTAEAGRGYVTQRAAERLDSRQSDFVSDASNGSALASQAAVLHRDEAFLMTAGFLFAFVVAAIIAIDQFGSRSTRPSRLRTRAIHRWQYGMLVAGAVALAVGILLLVVFAVDPVLTAVILGVLTLILVAEWIWLRRASPESQAAPTAAVSQTPPHRSARPQWWAEILGAIALVAFTASAVGLSMAAIQERESIARADRESTFALDLARVGQQQALRALASLSFIAQMEADEVTAAQLAASQAAGLVGPSAADPDAVAALRDVVDERMRAADQDLREQSADTLAAQNSSDCPSESASEAPLPSALLEELGSDPDSVLWYVLDQQRPSRACDVMSALSWQEARIWSAHGSTFTVALVVIGLAAFLLALAAGSERSNRSSRTLLIIGGAGAALGVVMALIPLPALLVGTGVPRGDSARLFGEGIAASESDSCTAGAGLDDAIAVFGGYGPAFVGRAFARDCAAALHEWPAYSPEIDPAAIPGVIDDLERAMAVGPVTPLLESNLGWYRIIDGIESDDDAALRRGLGHTDAALAALTSDPEAGGNGIHITRFNRALALAGLGDRDGALQAYWEAERCLDPEAACAGGGLVDPGVEDLTRLGALADLELLSPTAELDAYRTAILGLQRSRGPAIDLGDARFDVYPQELQVDVIDADGPADVKIIWYYRPDDSLGWGLLTEASTNSLRGGNHLDFPVSAGWLLESGEYRADVYVGGRRLEFVADYVSDGTLVRLESQRLGISMVVPEDWSEWWDDGVEWHVGPDDSAGVTVRRVEGIVPSDVDAYLEDALSTWWATSMDAGLSPVATPWLFGLPHVVVKQGEDVDGDGQPDIIEGAGLAPYASQWGCGGALFEIRAASVPGSPVAWQLYDSIALERPLDGLPAQGTLLEADGVSLQVPAWWDAAIRPPGSTGDLFSAKDCAGGANLLLSTDEYEGDLTAYVDETLAFYEGTPEEYPEFELESRTALDVPGADAAELLVYTWVPEGSDEPLRQWQMYAMRGTTVAYGTITTWAADQEYWQPDLDVILPSMAMTDP